MSHSRILKKSLITVPAFFSVLVLASGWGLAQLELGTFQGTVKDDSGQPIAEATFHMKDLARGGEITFESNKKGSFYRRGIKASEYELTIEKEGYQPFRDRLTFKAGEEKRLQFLLGAATSPAEDAFQRGMEAFGKGDVAKATEQFEEAARLAPDSAEAHTNLGLLYLQLSRIDDGIKELEKAVELDPEPIKTQLQLAAAYAQGEQVENAVAGFEKVLESLSDLSDPLTFEATLSLASLYFAAGRVEESITTYEKTLEAQPDSPASLLGLDKCHFNQGDQERALELFERVVATAPESPQAKDARVFIEELKAAQQ